MDKAIHTALRPEWKKNYQKQQVIRGAIYESLVDYGYSEEDAANTYSDIYDMAQRQDEYDG